MKNLFLSGCLLFLAGCKEKIDVGDLVVCTVGGRSATGTVESVGIRYDEKLHLDYVYYSVRFSEDQNDVMEFAYKWVKRLKKKNE